LDVNAQRGAARTHWGLSSDKPVLLVTGGSLGARAINEAVIGASAEIDRAGIQVLHITGEGFSGAVPVLSGYRAMPYCDDMGQALAAASLVVCRSGASTVSEVSALGLPAVYVPYPVGNGEQKLNARDAVAAGAAIVIDDASFTSDWITANIIPLVSSAPKLHAMAEAATRVGTRQGSAETVALIREALTETSASRA
jgi:UDP-N-acetylglucosamine--N-acetylmuramyl-(pentapeptide) pyrophosphoryl-undecaprenol N-acetylglucosamine transferase